MSITALELKAKVTADTKAAEDALQRVQQSAENASGKQSGGGLKGLVDHALSIAGGLSIFHAASDAVGFLADQVRDSIAVAQQYQLVQAQTTAVLKSTHDASGQTAQSIADLAEHLSTITPFSRDATQSAENMLLTFRGISGKAFPEATQATLDMATAMHMDATTAALQLGKALNDPATGMARLQREGVTFTKAQIEAAKHMEATGNLAGAQAIVLRELQTEFGGSAQAAGQTFAGALQILQNKLEDTKEQVGAALIPVLTQLLTALAPLMQAFAHFVSQALGGLSGFLTSTLIPTMQQWLPVIGAILSAAQTLGSIFLSALQPALAQIAAAFHGAHGPGLTVQQVLLALHDVAQRLAPIVRQAGQVFGELAVLFVTKVLPVIQQLANYFVTNVLPVLLALWNVIITDVVPAFESIMQSIVQHVWPAVQQLIASLENLWNHIEPVLIPVLQFLGSLLRDVIAPIIANVVLPVIGHLVGAIAGVINVVANLIGWIGDALGWLGRLKDFLGGALSSAWNGLGSLVSGIWSGISGAVKGGINDVIGIVNGLIRAIDGIHINLPKVGPFGGGSVGFNIPTIPQLAAGGTVTDSGAAIVGERGAELLNLPRGASVLPLSGALAGALGGGAPQYVQVQTTIQLDGYRIAQVVTKHQPKVIRNATGFRDT